MDPIQTIGQKLQGHEERDAIHIAILPVVAGEDLFPGDLLAFAYGSNTIVIRSREEYGVQPSVGVVDPFFRLTGARKMQAEEYDVDELQLKEGDRFWMFMHPNTVTGIRHHWSHPAVDNPPKIRSEAEGWLRRFADKWGFNWDAMLEAATLPVKDEYSNYIVAHGVDLHDAKELGADYELFWQHLTTFTGKTYSQKHRKLVSWSCSC